MYSSIEADPAVTYAIITWETNEPTTGMVEFGLSEHYGTIVKDTTVASSHTVQISGLSPETLHHYRVVAVDQAGNVDVSTNMVFTTVKVKAIVLGTAHACAVTTAGEVKCWGRNIDGSYYIGGDGRQYYFPNSAVPVTIQGLSEGVVSVGLGYKHACVITISGGVKCWGRNDYGQLGDGTTIDRSHPVDVVGLSSGVSSIAMGVSHVCALTTSGGVKCWGDNGSGQLGDGTTISKSTPVDVTGLASGIATIAAGYSNNNCAMTTVGGIKCWGNNQWGQLGDGTTTDRSIPVDVIGLTSGVVSIAFSGDHTCVVTISGGVKCWGRNDDYQLGGNTTTTRNSNPYSSTPIDVVGLSSGVASIALCDGNAADPNYTKFARTCALTATGEVKCWGGDYGVLKDIEGLSSGIASIALTRGESYPSAFNTKGTPFNCVQTISGGVKCWGYNQYGQLGNGSFGAQYSSYPVADVMGLH